MKQILKPGNFCVLTIGMMAMINSIDLIDGTNNGASLMAQEPTLTKLPVADGNQPSAKITTGSSAKSASATSPVSATGGGDLLDVKMKAIDGSEVDLSVYKGKVIVVVNTASKCGFTRQYKQLEKIHQSHHEQGLVVLGFPCNQFGGQEPAGEKEIVKFCQTRFGVTFDLFAKSDVNGDDRNALYGALCKLDLQPKGKGDVSWNFEKFVIGRDGKAVGRFSSRVSPTDQEFVSLLETQLAKEAPVVEPEPVEGR